MEIRELTCIGCPMGCQMRVTMEAGEIRQVEGNTCRRGDVYARKEVTNPTRIVTSTVSVKTASDIPKEKIRACVLALKSIRVAAPVSIGDVVAENVAGTGVSIVATRNVKTA